MSNPLNYSNRPICTTPGCGKLAASKGLVNGTRKFRKYCERCYRSNSNAGKSPTSTYLDLSDRPICTTPGCGKLAASKGLVNGVRKFRKHCEKCYRANLSGENSIHTQDHNRTNERDGPKCAYSNCSNVAESYEWAGNHTYYRFCKICRRNRKSGVVQTEKEPPQSDSALSQEVDYMNDHHDKFDQEHEDYISDQVEKHRKKLLDLGLRNRLLNFGHPRTSRNYIRIVDELPNNLYSQLITSNKGFNFDPLPDDKSEPQDEKTPKFRQALEATRQVSVEYKEKLEGLSEDDASVDDEFQLERWLRNKVRSELGMSPITDPSKNLVEYAQAHGVNPDIELPKLAREDKKHEDRLIQTLYLPKELERRIKGLRDYYRQAIEERGINTLYIALGFLEWYPSTHSNKKIHSPLILLQLEIERAPISARKSGEIERCTVKSSDSEATFNASLAAKLENDFGISLPRFEDGTEPEKYFEIIENEVIKERPWSIKRWGTICHLSFQKISMYQDLISAGWEKQLTQHPLIREAIGGRFDQEQSDNLYADDYQIDKLPDREMVDLLIRDADSSQHSALVDALNGKNIVIEGPPGTGKSQTITNLIALALHRGKTVLFVAEKLAALNVVKSRLDDVAFNDVPPAHNRERSWARSIGIDDSIELYKDSKSSTHQKSLGDFCLELHSTKISKTSVHESIKNRDELKSIIPDAKDFTQKTTKLWKLKAELGRHFDWLNAKVGNADLSVHRAIWIEILAASKLGELSEKLNSSRINNALDLGKEFLDQLIEILGSYIKYSQELINLSNDGGSHNSWDWITKKNIGRFETDQLISCMDEFKDNIHLTNTLLLNIRELTGQQSLSLPEGIKLIESISCPDPSSLEPKERLKFIEGDFATIVEEAEDSARIYEENSKMAALHCNNVGILFSKGEYVNFASSITASKRFDDLTSDQMLNISKKLSSDLKNAYPNNQRVTEALDLLGIDPSRHTVNMGSSITQLATQLAEIEFDHLALICSPICSNRNKSTWERLTHDWNAVKKAAAALSIDFELDYLPSLKELRDSSLAAKTTTKIGRFFSKEFKSAKKLYLGLCKTDASKTSVKEQADKLDKLAQYKFNLDELDANPCWKMFPELAPKGVEADLDALGSAFYAWCDIEVSPRSGKIIADFRKLSTEKKLTLLEYLHDINPRDCLALDGLYAYAKDDTTLSECITTIECEVDELEKEISDREKIGVKSNVSPNKLRGALCYFEKANKASKTLKHFASKAQIEDALIPEVIESIPKYANFLKQLKTLPECESIRGHYISNTDTGFNTIIANQKRDIEKARNRIFPQIEKIEDLAGGIPIGKSEEFWQIDFPKLENIFTNSVKNIEQLEMHQRALEAKDLLIRSGIESSFLEAALSTPNTESLVGHCVYYAYSRSVLELVTKSEDTPLETGFEIDNWRRESAIIDKQIKSLSAQKIASKLSSRYIPRGVRTGRKTSFTDRSLLRHEYRKKKAHIPIRKLIARSKDALLSLKPCFLMSPQSVAEYLPTIEGMFDIVVIDEASQMRPEDSLSALARGRQLVVVGDDKQLPPSSSFLAVETVDDDDLEEEPAESILEMASKVYSPIRQLRWHYRSRHESLITFSNEKFYRNQLVVFPSAEGKDTKLGITYVDAKGIYNQGTNPIEALRTVKIAISLMESDISKSIGIATMNLKQRQLILGEFETLSSTSPGARAYLEKWDSDLENFFVKNLENVQGDERDIIIISTLYGPPPTGGKPHQRFGPINMRYGHRRLNVLFSRAKERMIVVSSIQPQDIVLDPKSSAGVGVFRSFLQYARDGYIATSKPSSEPDSEFEQSVGDLLEKEGYHVDYQVGCIGYSIDIGIRVSDSDGRHFIGLECDGAPFHSSRSARDRDVLREEQLRSLGWNILRIWSTDWYRSRSREEKRVITAVKEAKEKYVSTHGLASSFDASTADQAEPLENDNPSTVGAATLDDILGGFYKDLNR